MWPPGVWTKRAPEITECLQRWKELVSHLVPHLGPSVSQGASDWGVPLVGKQQIYHPAVNNCNIHHMKKAISAAWIPSFILLQVEEVLDIHDGLWNFKTEKGSRFQNERIRACKTPGGLLSAVTRFALSLRLFFPLSHSYQITKSCTETLEGGSDFLSAHIHTCFLTPQKIQIQLEGVPS